MNTPLDTFWDTLEIHDDSTDFKNLGDYVAIFSGYGSDNVFYASNGFTLEYLNGTFIADVEDLSSGEIQYNKTITIPEFNSEYEFISPFNSSLNRVKLKSDIATDAEPSYKFHNLESLLRKAN